MVGEILCESGVVGHIPDALTLEDYKKIKWLVCPSTWYAKLSAILELAFNCS